jgi:serine phosphatase RsbU (regulator of sigma subunit)
LSYLRIDKTRKQLTFSRAGHCPFLHHHAASNTTEYLEDSGLGLGIIRSGDYSTHVSVSTLPFDIGDIMILYTDGIVEAMNSVSKEEYGYERLKTVVSKNTSRSANAIKEAILQDLNKFLQDAILKDDLTLTVIKFL